MAKRKSPQAGNKKKNLKKVDGGRVNQHGVFFTDDEIRLLNNAANAANRKRRKMLKEEAALPRMVGGRDTGDKVGSLHLMGKESDFVMAPKSKSLQRFKSKDDYNRYMRNLQRVNEPTYIDDRTRLYKRNHMKAIERAYGSEAKDVVMKIRMMKPEEYRRLVASNEDMEISFIYDPSARTGKLNQLRASLGMKQKEDELDY